MLFESKIRSALRKLKIKVAVASVDASGGRREGGGERENNLICGSSNVEPCFKMDA